MAAAADAEVSTPRRQRDAFVLCHQDRPSQPVPGRGTFDFGPVLKVNQIMSSERPPPASVVDRSDSSGEILVAKKADSRRHASRDTTTTTPNLENEVTVGEESLPDAAPSNDDRQRRDNADGLPSSTVVSDAAGIDANLVLAEENHDNQHDHQPRLTLSPCQPNGGSRHRRRRRPHRSLTEALLEEEDKAEDDGDNDDDWSFIDMNDEVRLEDLAKWVESYYPVLLLAVVVLLWPVGYLSFRAFQSMTDSTFRPLPGTLSRDAQDAFAAAFDPPSPQFYNASTSNVTVRRTDWSDPLHPPLYIVLEATSNGSDDASRNATKKNVPSLIANASSPAYQSARQYVHDLRRLLETSRWSWSAKEDDDEVTPADNGTGGSNASTPWFQVTDYFSMREQDLEWLADAWTSPDGSMLLVSVQYSFPPPKAASPPMPPIPPPPFYNETTTTLRSPLHSPPPPRTAGGSTRLDRERVHEVMAAIEVFGRTNYSSPEWFTVHYTGLTWFQSDLSASTKQDLKRMDYVVLPLAFVLMGLALRNSNPMVLWIIPLASMITVVSVWSVVMCFVAPHVQITQFTPTIMMSLTLGLGIDYTLFLLARYLEVVAPPPSFLSLAITPLPLDRLDGPMTPLDPQSRVAAVVHMVRHGGRVIVLSGATLICTFLGLCWLPLPMLKSVGIGAAVAILCALLVNLTLVPTLLISPLGVWIVKRRHRDGCDPFAYQELDLSVNSAASLQGSGRPGPRGRLRHDSSSSSAMLPSPPPSVWFRLSDHLLHPYRGLILLLVTVQVVVPIAMYAGKVKSSISFDLLLPRSSPSLQTFQRLSDHVGPGRLNPVRILFDARFTAAENNASLSMTSEQGFDIVHLVVDELLNMELSLHATAELASMPSIWDGASGAQVIPSNQSVPSATVFGLQSNEDVSLVHSLTTAITDVDIHHWEHVRNELMKSEVTTQLPFGRRNRRRRRRSRDHGHSSPPRKPYRTVYNGIAVLQNTRIPHGVFVTAKLCSQIKPHCPIEILHVLDTLDKALTSPYGGQATVVTATLGVDPFSDKGVAWITSARALIRQQEARGELQGVHVHVQSTASIEYDAQQAVYKALPWMMFITTVSVFVLMGAFFRSVFLPLRSIVSIGLTLGFSFGLGVLVYEKGVGNWTGLRSLSSPQNEFCWLVPVMSFSLIVGLALDYDVFLVSRILEYRLEGYEHKSSIAAALHSTGGIITAAGVIMAVAFGSLLFSSSAVLCQWSFLITAAVLFDTFVVRTTVVPIVTSLAGGRWCWWPREMPDPRVTMPEYVGGMDDVSGLLRTLERSSEYESLQSAAAGANGRP